MQLDLLWIQVKYKLAPTSHGVLCTYITREQLSIPEIFVNYILRLGIDVFILPTHRLVGLSFPSCLLVDVSSF